jgi:hypothetical protein
MMTSPPDPLSFFKERGRERGKRATALLNSRFWEGKRGR